jgi:hypothetical protein
MRGCMGQSSINFIPAQGKQKSIERDAFKSTTPGYKTEAKNQNVSHTNHNLIPCSAGGIRLASWAIYP